MGSTKTECIEDTQISVRMNSDDVLVWKKCYKIREVWGRYAPDTAANWYEFLEVWGRYAPDTAANWSEFLDVPGSLGSLRSGYCREYFCAPFLSNRNLTKLTRQPSQKALLQIGLKLPSLSKHRMSNWPGNVENHRRIIFLAIY